MQKEIMQENNTVFGDEVEQNKSVTEERGTAGEMLTEEHTGDPSLKTTRKRRPSKKALESSDLEKEVVTSRKPNKPAARRNALKSDDEKKTGHPTRQQSKSLRSTGSTSPRSSRRLSRPAKEPVDKFVKKHKVSPTVTLKAIRETPSKPRGKKKEGKDGNNKTNSVLAPKRLKQNSNMDNTLFSGCASAVKVQRSKDAANEDAGVNGGALSIVATNSGKIASSSVPMVPPKKRQRKNPKAEGHILLISKKSKMIAKLLTEISDVSESTNNKDSMAESGAETKLQLSTKVSDRNIGTENNSEGSELNRLQLEMQVCALNGTGTFLTGDHAKTEMVISTPEEHSTSDDGLKRPTCTTSVSVDSTVKHSETAEVQNEVVNDEASVEHSLNTCDVVGNGNGQVLVNLDNGEIRPGTAQATCNIHIENPNIQVEITKKITRKKTKTVEGEHVKKIKRVNVEGEVREEAPVKPEKKKRAKEIDEENVKDNTIEGATIKEKKQVRKTVKIENEATKSPSVKEKKGVTKTDTAMLVEGKGKELVEKKRGKKIRNPATVEGKGTEGAPAVEKKERFRKTDTLRVEEGDSEGAPVAKKKKKARKTDVVKVKGEATEGAPLTIKKIRVKKTLKGEFFSSLSVKVDKHESKIKKGEKEAMEVPIDEIMSLVKESADGVKGKGDNGTSIKEKKKVKKGDIEKIDVDIHAEVNRVKEIVEQCGETLGQEFGGGATEEIPRKEKKKSKRKTDKETDTVQGCGIEKKRKRKSENGDGTKQPVMCEKCGFIAGSKATLKKHDIRCHNEDNEDFVRDNPFKCSVCEYRAKKLSVIKRHVKKHGLEMCRFCQFVGESKILETHVRSEHQKMTKCKKCQRRIHNEDEDYDEHVANCQGQHEYKCEICAKGFKYKSVLKVHQITHDASLPKRFSCEHCNYQSHFKANLQKHIESKHSDRQRSISCSICEKLFFSESNLKKHLKNHTNERQHQCPHCEQSFKIAEGLKDHLVIHAPADPFKCEYEDCRRTFKYRRLLKCHLLEFHNELPKKLKCSHDGCELVFFKRSHLRRHESTHSGDRDYLCTWPDCGKAFRHADNLKVHYRQHTNEKPIQCTLCEFACRQRSSLSWHMKRHHNPAESTTTESETWELKNETAIEGDIAFKDVDEVFNYSTDSSATIEINTQKDLGSLADVAQVCELANPCIIVQPNKELRRKNYSEPKKPRKKKSKEDTDNVKDTKPKTERKPRKPLVRKEKVVSLPFPSGVNGANVIYHSEEKVSCRTVPEFKGSSEENIVATNDRAVDAVVKPKRKRRTREQMAAARAEMAAAKAAAAEAGEPPIKCWRRKKAEVTAAPELSSPPCEDVEVQQQDAKRDDYVDLSYLYKEKRPLKGKRLLNPDKIKEVPNVEKGKENVYDFDSDDENRGTNQCEHFDNNLENTHGSPDAVQQMHHTPVTNYHDVPRRAEMMLNPATGHMVVDMIKDKSVLPSRLLGNIVPLSPLDLDKIDRHELLETREMVCISEDQNLHDDGLKDEISASDIERDVREIIENDTGGVVNAPSDLPDEAQIFVDNNEEFPDRSNGEIIDRHLLQKYLEDTSMDGFERDLMKEEEKAPVSRNQFDNYVSPERKPEGHFDRYISPDSRPMSVQPVKGERQFESYMGPERRPISVQRMKPDGLYDKYVSPEHDQVLSNQSVVNHDTMSLPSNASQHGDSQWKGVESNKNSVIGAVDSPWTGPTEPGKQVETELHVFDLYAPEKATSHVPPLSKKYPNHLESARDNSAYRIPDYGSMYDTTTRMLASGLSSYAPVSSDSSLGISRPSTSFDQKDTLGYSQTHTPYLQSSSLYSANMNHPSNSYIDPRVDPYATSQLPSHASALQVRDNPLNSLAISASKYIESEINKTRVYNQQGWTLQETQSLRLTHSLFPNRNNDWEASSQPSSTYSYLSDRDMAGYNACSTARPPALSDRLCTSYLSGQTAESLEKQAFECYDMANYLNSRHAGILQPPSFNFDRQIAPLSSSAKAFTDSYRGASSIPDYRGLSHSATPELYTPNLNLDKYFYTRDSMYAPQRVPLPSENPFLSQPSSAAQPNFSSRNFPRGSVYSQPGAYQLLDNGKYSDPGKVAQPISSMQGQEFYLPRPCSATGHIQDPYRPPMLYNMMNRYFE